MLQLDDPAPRHDDDEAMNFPQWCERNKFSRATGQRIIYSGQGPDRVWFSKNRFGITYGADRRWKAARTVTATSAA